MLYSYLWGKKRRNPQQNSPTVYKPLIVSCCTYIEWSSFDCFCIFLLVLTHFSVARYFLPDPERVLCVPFCMSSGSFQNMALFGAENCITVPAGKHLKADCLPRLSLLFLLQKGNLICHPLMRTYFMVNARSLKQFTSPYSNQISPDWGKWYAHISNAQECLKAKGLTWYMVKEEIIRVWCSEHTESIFTSESGLTLDWATTQCKRSFFLVLFLHICLPC